MAFKYESVADLYRGVEADGGLAPIDHALEIQDALDSVGGWRGLFDLPSAEFLGLTGVITEAKLREKWTVIERLKAWLGCGLDRLIYMFAADNDDPGDVYKSNDVPFAIVRYAEHFREAEEYLMKCKHPVFRQHARRLVDGTAGTGLFQPVIPIDIHSIPVPADPKLYLLDHK